MTWEATQDGASENKQRDKIEAKLLVARGGHVQKSEDANRNAHEEDQRVEDLNSTGCVQAVALNWINQQPANQGADCDEEADEAVNVPLRLANRGSMAVVFIVARLFKVIRSYF